MHHFSYRDGQLFADETPVDALIEEYGTPLYIYSASTLRRHFEAFDSAFESVEHITCYSVKANSNLSILKLLREMGSGMDIVSGGELYRALTAGTSAEKIVYSGVGKSEVEIIQALDADILMFNVESLQELEKINAVAAARGARARVSLRINPDVDPGTHPYIATGLKTSKFGLDVESSLKAYGEALRMPGIEPVGVDFHLGSQLTSVEPFRDAMGKVMALCDQLTEMGVKLRYLDLGGGLGIRYDAEEPPHPTEFGEAVVKIISQRPLTLILEPGRVIAGNAGILVTRVLYTKDTPSKHFVIVDAGMNDLIRPSLYKSHHDIKEVTPMNRAPLTADVVGPICETGDFLARDRALPAVAAGEGLAVFSAGAYGFTMSSQYNSRCRAAEVMVDGDAVKLSRERETHEDLIAKEKSCL